MQVTIRTSHGFWVIAALCTSVVCPPVNGQCELQKITASDAQPGVHFGIAVDLDGEQSVIGGVWDSTQGDCAGAAYVFRSTETGWLETQKLFGSTIGPHDGFGVAISISGDTMLVGAPWDGTGVPRPGAVYVFDFDGSTWTETAELAPSDPVNGMMFGVDVALDGDLAIVGAWWAGASRGAAYVFERSGSTWSEIAKLTASDGVSGDYFGNSVTITESVAASGGLAFVGAPYDEGDSGSVYVFDGAQGWAEVAKLRPSVPELDAIFGISLAVSGETLAVGAYRASGQNPYAGAAYMFEKDVSGWTETAKLIAPDGLTGDSFGFSLDVDGPTVLVGAESDVHGTASVYSRDALGWQFQGQLVPSDMPFGAQFGFAVAVDEETAFIGAHSDDWQGTSPGSAYLFQFRAFATSYCFGTSCPCGNDAPLSGCANSVLGADGLPQGALLTACESASVTSDDLELRLSQLPPNKSAIVFMGGGQVLSPFGDGFQCVGAGGLGIFRYNPPQNSGSAGMITLGPGIVARSQSFSVNGHIDAGETWYFQGWYRDPMGPCGSAFNLSNALAVSFVP